MALPPGTRIGVYEITAPLGEGGMGQVYRATDTALNRQVAIKILPDAFKADPERLARFEREARTLASLSHPHIAAVHGFERSAGNNALVMELVEGEDLSRVIARGPMPVDEALAIANQIAEALEAAHEQGIIHRDLKPANIKVRPDGTIKVLDFGLAKAVSGDGSRESGVENANSPTLSIQATAAGMILGTAAYMSPEQARGRVTDKRTDVWAFGCVLFEMLSGKRAFDGEDVTEIIASVVKTTPNWSALPPSTPPRIVSLIQKCLEKDRKLRASDIGVARFVIGDDKSPVATSRAVAPSRSWLTSGAVTVALLLGLALASLAWIHFNEQVPLPKVVRYEIPAPAELMVNATAIISPDGKHVASLARPSGTAQSTIWLQSLDSLVARPLAGTEGAGTIFWSPDSAFIGFATQAQLRKISISGGAPQNICDIQSVLVRGASWGTSGDILFGQVGSGLMRVPETGGKPAPVTTLDTSRKEVFHSEPWFLPDGRHFLYTRDVNATDAGVYLGSLETPPDQQSLEALVAGAHAEAYSSTSDDAGWLLFIRESSLMAQAFDLRRLELTGEAIPVAAGFALVTGPRPYHVSLDGTLVYRTTAGAAFRRLTWFDRSGKILGTVAEPGAYNTVALSPDATRVVVSRGDANMGGSPDLWIYDLARGSSTRFTSDPGSDWVGIWSPDGSSIAFSSNRVNSDEHIYRKPSTGAVQEELLQSGPSREYPQDFSPDGSVLLLSASSSPGIRTLLSGMDIHILDLKDRKTRPYLKTEFIESQPKFSPDGRFVAYTSNASGRNEVYVQPYPDPSSGKWTVSVDGGAQPRWRRDGRELFFFGSDGQTMAVDVNTTKGFTAGVPKELFRSGIWGGGGSTNNVYRYDVTADGQRFLINVEPTDEKPPAINVVLNWQGLLKR